MVDAAPIEAKKIKEHGSDASASPSVSLSIPIPVPSPVDLPKAPSSVNLPPAPSSMRHAFNSMFSGQYPSGYRPAVLSSPYRNLFDNLVTEVVPQARETDWQRQVFPMAYFHQGSAPSLSGPPSMSSSSPSLLAPFTSSITSQATPPAPFIDPELVVRSLKSLQELLVRYFPQKLDPTSASFDLLSFLDQLFEVLRTTGDVPTSMWLSSVLSRFTPSFATIYRYLASA